MKDYLSEWLEGSKDINPLIDELARYRACVEWYAMGGIDHGYLATKVLEGKTVKYMTDKDRETREL